MLRPSRAWRHAMRFLLAFARHLGGPNAAHFIATATRPLTLQESATAARLLRSVRVVEAAESETPQRGRLNVFQVFAATDDEPATYMLRYLVDRMASAGIERRAVVTVDQSRRAEPGDIVHARLYDEPLPPPPATPEPVTVTVRTRDVIAYLCRDETGAWLEDDAGEIPNPHGGDVWGVAVSVQPPLRPPQRVADAPPVGQQEGDQP